VGEDHSMDDGAIQDADAQYFARLRGGRDAATSPRTPRNPRRLMSIRMVLAQRVL